MKKILAIGSVTADVLVKRVDALPKAGTLSGIDNVFMLPGGCAVNAAIDLKKLGADISLSCLIGNDGFGSMLLTKFKEVGLDTKGVIVSNDVSTTVSIVLINSNGERSFLYNPGSAAVFTKEHIDKKLTDEADIIFVAGEMLLPSFEGKDLAEFFSEMRSKGKITVMDTAWDKDGKWLERIKDALPFTDLFMPSREEAELISGKTDPDEIADFFFDCGCRSVIIKLGKEGALICPERETRFRQGCAPCREVVDTTGAGDSFCAGFLFGISNGWSFERSARFASCVASCCIEKTGASEGILSYEKTIERLGAGI